MEHLIMFISHLIKSAEFYLQEGIFIPSNIDELQGLIWQLLKIVSIYVAAIISKGA